MRGSFVAFVVLAGLVGGASATGGCANGGEPPGFNFADGGTHAPDGQGSSGSGSSSASSSSSTSGSGGASSSGGGSGSGAGSGSGSASSGGTSSGGGSTSSGSGSGGSGSTSGSGSGSGSSSGADAGGLDPGLVLPDPGGTPCSDPGMQCAGATVCRISSTTGGTCEGCSNCGNLHAACVTDADCDILFQCYEGYCDGFCQLATPQECGNPSDCVNVGNSTTGICKYP